MSYVRSIFSFTSIGRLSFRHDESGARQLTRTIHILCTNTFPNQSTKASAEKCGYSYHTSMSSTNHYVAPCRPNNSLRDNCMNCTVGLKINARCAYMSYAMARMLTMQRILSHFPTLHANKLPKSIIQSRKRTNQSKKDDQSGITKTATVDDNEKVTKQSDKYGMISNETYDQIFSILSQARSIPNVITITRICSTPFLSYLILTEQYRYALTGCVLAAISDGLDGYIARNYDGKTVLGTYLDPLADKIFINSIALTLTSVGVLPSWSVAIWIGKDVLLIVGSYRFVSRATVGSDHAIMDPARTPLKVRTTFISQVNTALQFGIIGFSLVMASIDILSEDIVNSLCMVSCGTTFASAISYVDGKSMEKSGNSDKIKTKKSK